MTATTTNPYSAPQAHVEDHDDGSEVEQTFSLNFFSKRGRMGRVRYLAYGISIWAGLYFGLSMTAGVAMAILLPKLQSTNPAAGQSLSMLLGFFVIVAFLYSSIMLTIKRCHDIGFTGWVALLMCIPLVSLLFWLVCLFVPGVRGANRYGKQPAPNSTGVVVVAFLVPVLLFVFIGIIAAIAIPKGQQLIERAKAKAAQQHQP